MLGWIWLGLILVAVICAGFTGNMNAVAEAVFDSARAAIDLVFGLVGVMVFFLGIMRVAFDGGLRDAIARALAPLTRRLFPDVPADHPAMGAMIMNLASNIVGMGNAATPFGLKAMGELARLNRLPGVASDPMVLFVAINTSAVTLLPPLGTIAVRAAAGSADPWSIWVPTLIATTCSTTCAVLAVFALRGRAVFAARPIEAAARRGTPDPSAGFDVDSVEIPEVAPQRSPIGPWRLGILWLCVILLFVGLGVEIARLLPEVGLGGAGKSILQGWLIPVLIFGLLLVGFTGRIPIYDSMIAGAQEGLTVAVRIVPYLVAILVAVAMFRASGALDLIISRVDPLTTLVGVPAEVLPMALLRPLSGSGAFAVMSEIITAHGPDSFVGQLTCTLMGSTETTFYALALYMGAAGVVETRHALIACLIGDLGGFVGAVVACHVFFG